MNTYTVRRGDSLSRIANAFNISLQELLATNPHITNPNLIFPGMEINVPDTGTDDAIHHYAAENADEDNWFALALRELESEVEETPGNLHNPRILEYHASTTLRATNDEVAWCSSFVNWCVTKAGLQGTDSAAARSWQRWGQRLDTPRKGCIVVISRTSNPAYGHVGFLYEERPNSVLLLGGNQGNKVSISSYLKHRLILNESGEIISFRWPE